MARDVDKLGKLLGKRVDSPTVGVVQSAQGDRLLVRTSTGVKAVTKAGTASYRKGDRVTLSGNVVTSKIRAAGTSTTVYIV